MIVLPKIAEVKKSVLIASVIRQNIKNKDLTTLFHVMLPTVIVITLTAQPN